MTEKAKELWPTVEVEWEGKKYTCNVDFGWAYRLDTKCAINVLDFVNMMNKAQGPKDFIGYLWAALAEHLPDLTVEEVAKKTDRTVVAQGTRIFAMFMASLVPEDSAKKKDEAEEAH